VASFNSAVPLNPSPQELESIFLVPLAVFATGIQIREDQFVRNGTLFTVPAYYYEGYEIWGFTAAVTAQLLRSLTYCSS
jgi:hypothetical protein